MNNDAPAPQSTEEPEEILAQTYLYDVDEANVHIRKWLATHAPQQPCRLTTDAPEGLLFQSFPAYWYYDITTLQHEPGEDPNPEGECLSTEFPHMIVDIVWHKVVGPIPPCPI